MIAKAIRQVDGRDYVELESGVLMPAEYLHPQRVKVRFPRDLLPLLAEDRITDQERLLLFTMNGDHQVIQKHLVTIGTATQTAVNPREIFRRALQDKAVSIMLAHNHPSGSLQPSPSDLKATNLMMHAGRLMGTPLIDHLIVTATDFYSIREQYASIWDPKAPWRFNFDTDEECT